MEMTWIVYGVCLSGAAVGWNLISETGGRLSGGKRSMRAFLSGDWKAGRLAKAVEKLTAERKANRYEREIGEAVSYLRNTVAMGRGQRMSTGLVLEELAELSGELAPAYLKTLHYLRLNEKEKAMDVLYLTAKSEMSRDLSRLLLQWEELPPAMLMGALESYQRTIREVRLTKQKKQDEMMSDLIYLPVIMNVMLVLINFIYVAYFIEQREALLTMFG